MTANTTEIGNTAATIEPTNAKQCAQQAIAKALLDHASDFTATDLLREFRRQSELLGETERVRELLISDPFEHWKENESLAKKIEVLGERLQVIDVHRVATLSGYSFIDAVVEISQKPPSRLEERKRNVKEKLKKKMERCTIDDRSSVNQIDTAVPMMQLIFRYERRSEESTANTETHRVDPGIDSPTVCYSIDLTNGLGPVQKLLWVQVWADGHRRTEHLTPVNLDEDGDADGWEDIDEDEDEGVDEAPEQKRQRRDEEVEPTVIKEQSEPMQVETPESVDERADRYVAGIDPEVLQLFIEWIGLGSHSNGEVSDVTIFFLLMTFPFFEHEWDIIGYLLDSVFGDASENGDDGKDEDSEG
ncbi:hypothetical protein FisN_6Hh295 [Fistulifera solaris]|jgi:hypothetical protein|uniref:Uncharacterized protein n=1 Tax=Fistulifera solaris TaxID=1519565 RepID=A0A1Z5K7X3_FISSO|nr:hypothetical protein FisN_6Hh295 [Fistulifera solaris]|eukprot:GAX22048.1 hypothetical protein FisN_6Hh295 [Fistulifera solaris]